MNLLGIFENFTDPESITLLTTAIVGVVGAICMGIKEIRNSIIDFITGIREALTPKKKKKKNG